MTLKIYDSLNIGEKRAEMLLYISFEYKQLGDYIKALDYYEKTMKIAVISLNEEDYTSFGTAMEGVKGMAYLGIAQAATASLKQYSEAQGGRQGILDSAIKYLGKGVIDNEKTGNFGNLEEFGPALSDAYVLTGNYKKAYEAIRHFHIIMDSVRNGEDKKQDETKEMVRKLNESQIRLNNKQLNTEKKAQLFFIAGLGLLLLLVIFILKNSSNQKKANKLILKEKEQISRLKNEIEEKHTQTIDSVNYAKRIQAAVLPSINEINRELPASFVMFRPKDIVSGDFYWFSKIEHKLIIAAVDCTGHGVPGAFMSMIGNSLLNQIINEKGSAEPALILNQLNSAVIEALKQSENASHDGMDVSICLFDLANNELQYAGANRPLWLLRNNEIEIFRPDKFPIGGLQAARDRIFTNYKITLQKNDTVYIFSDGYADQFGGEKGKKLMTSKFKEMLLSIQRLDMQEQEKNLEEYFEKWKGSHEQVDDVLVIGVRV